MGKKKNPKKSPTKKKKKKLCSPASSKAIKAADPASPSNVSPQIIVVMTPRSILLLVLPL
ncbi:unnamed protein product [Brassica oleracea var. botrytis]